MNEMIKETQMDFEHYNIVIVTEVQSFTMRSIHDFLQANNVSVKMMGIKEENLDLIHLNGDYILIRAEDFTDINYGCLIKIERQCQVNDASLIIFGSSDDVAKVKGQLESNVMALELERLGDMQVVKKRLLNLVYKEKREKRMILAIDDSGIMLRTLASWLDEEYDLILANSASKAMAMLSTMKPDLILLDYEMPVCSGAQFFQMLKEDSTTRYIPVIFLTAKDDKETVKEVVNLRPAGYLLKTTTKEQILSKICQVLDKEW